VVNIVEKNHFIAIREITRNCYQFTGEAGVTFTQNIVSFMVDFSKLFKNKAKVAF